MVIGVLYALGAVTASAPYCSAGDVFCAGHGVRHVDLGTARMEHTALLAVDSPFPPLLGGLPE